MESLSDLLGPKMELEGIEVQEWNLLPNSFISWLCNVKQNTIDSFIKFEL